YSQYHGRIYAFCYRFFRQTELSEEATADVFIKLWEKRETIDPSLNILPFLFKIAKDISLNYLKQVARNEKLKQAYVQRYLQEMTPNTEKQLIRHEEIQHYLQIVEHLPPKRKEIFKMRYIQEMDYQSIADRLNLSPNTVKVQLVKARKFLKLRLLEHESKASLR
ncbi:MAG: RNA polymerase sigma-70 factor, partial [Bacteroidota bacterium]